MKILYSVLRSKNGFTIIESIVALTIIIAAVIGPFMLISRGILTSKSAKNRLIASNLAQEGIEMIRYFRDSNILSSCVGPDGADPDEDPDPDWRAVTDTSSNCSTLTDGDWEVDATVNIVDTLEPRLIVITPGGDVAANYRILNFCRAGSYSGLYAYICTGDSNPLVTAFRRRINISSPGSETVCTDPPGLTPCSGASAIIPAIDRLLITVTIYWQDGAVARTLTQREVLYNWR